MTSLMNRSWLVLWLLAGLGGAIQAQARGLPDFTELVEHASDAVVNISTTQKVKAGSMNLPEGIEIPDLPEGSPFGDLFKHFFGDPGQGCCTSCVPSGCGGVGVLLSPSTASNSSSIITA